MVTCLFCGGSTAPAPRVIERVVVVESGAEAGDQWGCPRCGNAMHDAGVAGASLLVCSRCGGSWVDPATFERLGRERDDRLPDAARRAIGIFAPKDHDWRTALACPGCRATLRRLPLGESDEHYDVCEAHGAFFDHGELAAFIAAETERRAGAVTDDDLAAAGITRGGWRWPWQR